MESVDDFVAGLGAFWDAAMTPAGLVIIAAGVALIVGMFWLMRRGDR